MTDPDLEQAMTAIEMLTSPSAPATPRGGDAEMRAAAQPAAGAAPSCHGRRTDATDSASQDAASAARGSIEQSRGPQGVVPAGSTPNGDFAAPYRHDPQVWVDRIADLAIANLRTLRNYINEHRDSLKLSEVMGCLELIDDERRMIRLGGLSDAPLVARGRLIDEYC